VFAPIFTANGIAAFGRDPDSAKQVWSKHEGYPGDARYRDFYRDIGFDLDYDYIKPYLPDPDHRGFTGIKYHRITGRSGEKQVYDRDSALRVVAEHADHFLQARIDQIEKLSGIMDRPPLVLHLMMQSCLVIGGMKGSNSSISLFGGLPPSDLSLITPTNICDQPTNKLQARVHQAGAKKDISGSG
jgi:predicted glycosyl hydrolase (DUF1957 family)